jgi:hypothetical protein
LLALQATAGNAATVEHLRRSRQAKLSVGATDDPFERAADSAADAAVEQLHAPALPAPSRRVEVGAPSFRVPAPTEDALRRTRGRGHPLDEGRRTSMESALATDLSRVRVHDGPEARTLCDDLGARAFTLGTDVFFRDGLPHSQTRADQQLVAHELAHAVQQGADVVRRIINPHASQTEFLKRYKAKPEKFRTAVAEFYDACKASGMTYTPDEMHDALRSSEKPADVKRALGEIEKRKAREADEAIGGEKFHSADRHITISDADMEGRLRGTRGWEKKGRATRIESSDNVNRAAVKFLKAVKPEVQAHLGSELKRVSITTLTEMHSGVLLSFPNDKQRKEHIVKQAELEAEPYDLDSGKATITLRWRVTPLHNPPSPWPDGSIQLRCEYEVESTSDFAKEVWSLDPDDDSIVKGHEVAPVTMYSGQNSPEVVVEPDDDNTTIADKVAQVDLSNIGVTMF